MYLKPPLEGGKEEEGYNLTMTHSVLDLVWPPLLSEPPHSIPSAPSTINDPSSTLVLWCFYMITNSVVLSMFLLASPEIKV